MASLDTVLADCTWALGYKSGVHTDDVRRANEAIEAAARVVFSAQ